jgi:hypothetical protein
VSLNPDQGHAFFQSGRLGKIYTGPKKKTLNERRNCKEIALLFLIIEWQMLFGLYIIPCPRHASNVRKQWPLRSSSLGWFSSF